jgi:hypothetical protein
MTPDEYSDLIKTLQTIKAMRIPPRKINGIYGSKKWSEVKYLFDERVNSEVLEYWIKLLKDAKKKAKSASSYKKTKAIRNTKA